VEDGIKKFNLPLKPFILTGTKTKRLNDLYAIKNQPSDIDIIILNYEQVLSDEELKLIAAMDISIICCDESVRLGNIKNKTYKQINKLANYKKCKRLCLSGDPIANNPLEAFALFSYLNPGCLGNWFKFVSDYFSPAPWSIAGFVKLDKLPHLAARLAPYYIRRSREELLPYLPELLEQVLPVTQTPQENKLYNQIKTGLLLEIEQADISKLETPHTMDAVIVKFARLRQLCISPELLGETTISSKLSALKEFVSTIGSAKALIFTEFASAVPLIRANLPSGASLEIQGSTPQESRQGIMLQFQTDPQINYLILTSAGEMGLNLQAADYVIHLDPPLTYSSYDQRCSRAHRQGRKDKVISVRMVTAGTLEERIYKLIENKKLMSLAAMPYSLMKELV
jgi:SNF2 family DNA or RNA helicase